GQNTPAGMAAHRRISDRRFPRVSLLPEALRRIYKPQSTRRRTDHWPVILARDIARLTSFSKRFSKRRTSGLRFAFLNSAGEKCRETYTPCCCVLFDRPVFPVDCRTEPRRLV